MMFTVELAHQIRHRACHYLQNNDHMFDYTPDLYGCTFSRPVKFTFYNSGGNLGHAISFSLRIYRHKQPLVFNYA